MLIFQVFIKGLAERVLQKDYTSAVKFHIKSRILLKYLIYRVFFTLSGNKTKQKLEFRKPCMLENTEVFKMN